VLNDNVLAQPFTSAELYFFNDSRSKPVSHSYPRGTKLRVGWSAFNMESARWEKSALPSFS
jgi:hypothetical protein